MNAEPLRQVRPLGGVVTVYLDRLRTNAEVIAKELPGRGMPVLKGNAYGFDLAACGPAVAIGDFARLVVGTADEANALRSVGVTATTIVTDGRIDPDAGPDVEWLLGEAEIRWITEVSTGHPVRVHVDVDFGVGRGGLRPDDLSDAIGALLRTGADVVGLAGQLPAGASSDTVSEAVGHLVAARRRCPEAVLHLGGSDAIRWASSVPEVAIRVGRALFGVVPREASRRIADNIIPVSAWQATATPYTPPERVGYSGKPPPPGMPVRIDAGFAHGLPIQAAGKWPLLVAGVPYLIHEVFMLCAVAYPVGADVAAADPVDALLSGWTPAAEVPIRSVASAMGVSTTTILMAPRSVRRELA